MPNHLKMPGKYRMSAYNSNGLRLLIISAAALILFQTGCGKKSKAVFTPAPPARVAFLPLNVAENQNDLHWVAIAAPILLAQISERAPDLEAVPFWESMPVAVESAGASRIFTDASAESAASWLSAEWGVMGEVSPAPRDRISLIVDFIPVGGRQIPFRYMKTRRIDSIAEGFPTAFTQFLRYLAVRPLEKERGSPPSLSSMRTVAEALDREYGWFVEAEPGTALDIVDDLLKRNESLARFLFSPKTYPQLKTIDD
jgi:hypothetical protein